MPEKETVGFLGGKFIPLHLGHIYAGLEASNQVDKLFIILSSSKNRDRELCDKSNIKYIPAEIRLSWLGESFNHLDNVEIIHIEDDQWDHDYDWADGARMIKEAIGRPIDIVFSSETDYDYLFKKFYPQSKHVIIDNSRNTVNISATEMRNNLYAHWDKIPLSVRKHYVFQVAIVGTESCGKSTLTEKLAKFYNTNFMHEIGRDYCVKYSNQIAKYMFNQIAMEHYMEQQKRAELSNRVLLVDTEAVVTQYYLDMYHEGQKSNLVEEIAKLQDYDLVLFLEPDVKWVPDGFRFKGEKDQRNAGNAKLKEMYRERGIEFVSIAGNYQQRFQRAKAQIDDLLKRNNAFQ